MTLRSMSWVIDFNRFSGKAQVRRATLSCDSSYFRSSVYYMGMFSLWFCSRHMKIIFTPLLPNICYSGMNNFHGHVILIAATVLFRSCSDNISRMPLCSETQRIPCPYTVSRVDGCHPHASLTGIVWPCWSGYSCSR